MADHRDPGTGGEPDQPGRDQPHDDAEPEFGSSEWLLAQLTGGRRVERSDETSDTSSEVSRNEAGAGGSAEAPASAEVGSSAEVPAPASGGSTPVEAEPVVGAFDELLRESEPERIEPAGETHEPRTSEPTGSETSAPVGFAELLREPPPSAPDESTEQDDAAAPLVTAPQGFVWNLTSRQSGDGDDSTAATPTTQSGPEAAEGMAEPAAAGETEDALPPVRRTNFVEPPPTEPTASSESAPVAPDAPVAPMAPDAPVASDAPVAPMAPDAPVASDAPVAPMASDAPVAPGDEPSAPDSSATPSHASPAEQPPARPVEIPAPPVEPAASPRAFEPPSFVAALRMPRPPEWGDVPMTTAEPIAPDGDVAPESASEGDVAPPSAPEQPTNDTAPLQGHGLAALLGAHQEERPAARPLLGDTTGIIPLPPTYTPPPTTPEPASAGPAEPSATTAGDDLPAAAAVDAGLSATPDVSANPAGSANPAPASRREALRAEEEAATAAIVPPPLIEPAPPEPVRPPDATPFGSAAQTEALLGAPPSPATSPFDAEALADASVESPTVAIPIEGIPDSAAPDEPLREQGAAAAPDERATGAHADLHTTDAQEVDDEPDGIAALFGDFTLDDESADDLSADSDSADADSADADSAHHERADTDPLDDASAATVVTGTPHPATEHQAASAPADESAPADASTPGETATQPDPTAAAHSGAFGIDAILFPELADDSQAAPDTTASSAGALFVEPSAAMEGPQLDGVPEPVVEPDGFDAEALDTDAPDTDTDTDTRTYDSSAAPTVAFDAAAAAREPLTPAAPAPPAPAAPTDSPAVSSPAVPSPAVSAPTGGARSTITQPASPATSPGEAPPEPSEPPRGPRDPRFNRRVYLIAGVLAVLLVLVGLFALGTRIPSLFGAAAPSPHASASRTPSATPTPTPTPTPTVIPKPAAAVAPGDHAWDTLGGGECIQPYSSPWAETFTVVDCTADHTAQMVYTNLVSADPAAPYPGADALAQQINALCTAGGVIDLNAAAAYPDLQVQGTFPATEEQWKSGQRSYYCFATRSSGQPLTTSVQGQGPTG